MKLGDLNDLMPSLLALNNTDLPAHLAFRASDALDAAMPAAKKYNDLRNKLLTEFGVETSPGKFEFLPDNRKLYDEQEALLSDEEVSIAFPKIWRSELGSVIIKGIHLSKLRDVVIFADPEKP